MQHNKQTQTKFATMYQFFELYITLDIWKVPMKKLYYYACKYHCIVLEYATMLHVSIIIPKTMLSQGSN